MLARARRRRSRVGHGRGRRSSGARGGSPPTSQAVIPNWSTCCARWSRSIDAESYAQCCEAIGTMDLRSDLARIAAPTLVIAGADDPATPPDTAEVIANGIAGASLQILDDAAHIATSNSPRASRDCCVTTSAAVRHWSTGYATRRAVLGDAHVDRTNASTTPPLRRSSSSSRATHGATCGRAPSCRVRDRSIATLAVLVSLAADHELAMHVRAARRNGLTDDEIVEVVMHCALYAGLPRANRAIDDHARSKCSTESADL